MKNYFENVIVIEEECHGFIGIAHDVPSVIDFLCQNDWLNEYTEIYIEHELSSVRSVYGENWCEYFKGRTLNELADIFDGRFYFRGEKVW